MYVYSTKQEPNVPKYSEKWEELLPMKEQGELAFFKQVSDVNEGIAFIATKYAEYVAPKTEPAKPREKWCAATQSLTIYKNDKGYFTRRYKKVGEDWKNLFIPIYFADGVTLPEGKKSNATVDLHWDVSVGNESMRLVIIVDKIHTVEDLPF